MERILMLFCIVFISITAQTRDPLPLDEAATIIKEFQYPSTYTELETYKDGGYYDTCWLEERVIETTFPQMKEPLKIEMRVYVPNREFLAGKTVPTVIMLPPTGGMSFLDTQTAKTLCSYDMAAIILQNDFANIESQASGTLLPVEDHQQSYYRVGAAVKASMEFIRNDANMDYDRMGLFGISLGGILSSFVMATQADIAAGYFLVAGGDVPNILAHSDQEHVSKIRQKRMSEQGFSTREEYEEYLRQHMTFDPIDIAGTMVPETLRMVIADRDSKVPTPNQYALHVAFGEPEATYHNEGHLDTILSVLLFAQERREVAKFFQKRFEAINPRPEKFHWLQPVNLVQAN